jgi:hypothetical protein
MADVATGSKSDQRGAIGQIKGILLQIRCLAAMVTPGRESGRSDRWMKRPVANALLTTGVDAWGDPGRRDVAADRLAALAAFWPHGDAQGCCLLRISE